MNKLAFPNSKTAHPIHRLRFIKRRSRHGMTLIELLIAVALTLVIITAMIRAFRASSEQISLGRAKMDMHNKLRLVSEQLRRDLQNATKTPNPSVTSDGYLEIVEGAETDADHATAMSSYLGDHDDFLALTVRSDGEPFRGRFNGAYVESYLAEVIWWVVHDDTNSDLEASRDESVRLYRRVMLIRPDLVTAETNIVTYYDDNDISVRPDGGGGLVANSLEDLANRANRFAHNSAVFPHELITAGAGSIYTRILTGDAEGQDLMLDNCVAFDLKVYDPRAQVFRPHPDDIDPMLGGNPSLAIGQSIDFDDPGFMSIATRVGSTPGDIPLSYPQMGAYVNLGYDEAGFFASTDRWFSSVPWSTVGAPFTSNTYCTWWNGYESDGIDQDGDGLFDEGSDGIDNDGANGVDDLEERETRPPYNHPLRSIQVSVRIMDKNSNQMLQKTIRESFVPN